jgi:hypothetical protein
MKLEPEYVDRPPYRYTGTVARGLFLERWHEDHYVLACGGRHIFRYYADGSVEERIYCKDTGFQTLHFLSQS